jgi:hypothetical protein
MALFELSLHTSQSLVVQIISVFVLFHFGRWLRNRSTRHSIAYLPGPERTDLLFGNLGDLHFSEVGTSHFSWQKKHGLNFKVHGLLGVRIP